jgi:hypothetical protein
LGVKPIVECSNKLGILSTVSEFGAASNVSVSHLHFASFYRLQVSKARHAGAMNVRCAGKITFFKLPLYVMQMLSHQPIVLLPPPPQP